MTKRIYTDRDYLEDKFKDISGAIGDLKVHVNEEIQLIRIAIEKLEKKTTQITWGLAILFVLLLIHDVVKVSVFDVILRLFGVNIPASL